VARADRHNVRLKRFSEQGNVADDIENLVAHKFVWKPERLLGQNLISLDNDSRVEAAALNLAHLQKRLDVLVDGKCPGRCDL